ncbi:MAG: glutamate 5-kinase [Brevinematia bacterium]
MILTIKVGTKLVMNEQVITKICSEIANLHLNGNKVILVSSGAVALGRKKLNFYNSANLTQKQALSSVGQIELMKFYQSAFSGYGINIGQILITYHDLNSNKSILNLRNTIYKLFDLRVLPIINENDATATEEIKFGNNDILAAMVSSTIFSEKLIILTDVDGIFKNFNTPQQELIRDVRNVDDVIKFLKGKQFDLSVGGMKTKIQAGYISMKSGIECVIANGFKDNIIAKVLSGDEGTRFVPEKGIKTLKERFLILSKKKGSIIVDDGAVEAVRNRKSLLPVGIKEVIGKFSIGDVVFIQDQRGKNIGIGITNYSSSEVKKIKGIKSKEIGKILGISNFDEEVVHADNMIIL